MPTTEASAERTSPDRNPYVGQTILVKIPPTNAVLARPFTLVPRPPLCYRSLTIGARENEGLLALGKTVRDAARQSQQRLQQERRRRRPRPRRWPRSRTVTGAGMSRRVVRELRG